MKYFKLTLIFTSWIRLLSAQSWIIPVSRIASIGTYSRHFQDALSAWANPAGLTCLPTFTTAIYAERRFSLKALSLNALTMAVPVHAGAFGWSIVRFGNMGYHRQQISGAYGSSLGKKVRIGLKFNYENIAVQGYKTIGKPGFEAGLLWHANKQLSTGLHVSQSAYSPAIISGGIGLETSCDLLLMAEAKGMVGNTVIIKAGIFYRIIPALALQLGVASSSSYNNAAVIFQIHDLRIDIAASLHPQLGITPSTLLTWKMTARTTSN